MPPTPRLKTIQEWNRNYYDTEKGSYTKPNTDFGIEYVLNKHTSETKYPNIYKHKNDIINRFNLMYQNKFIGFETEGRFISELEDTFFTISDGYDHSFYVYDNLTDEKYDGVINKTTSEYDINNDAIEYPNDNAQDDFTNTREKSHTAHKSGLQLGSYLDAKNHIVGQYRSIVSEFCNEFREDFMSMRAW